jgi:hypothetical protein
MRGRLAGAVAALLAIFAAGALLAQSAPRRPAAAPAAAERTAPTIPASITIKSAFAALDERVSCALPQTLYLTVTNEGAENLVVHKVTLLAPSDLQLCRLPGGPPPVTDSRFSAVIPDTHVGAGRRAVVALPVATRATPRPGAVPLLVEVELVATIGGAEQSDVLLASDQVEVRIPGLSDVLQLFGVPTLFLLPGLLILAAATAARSGWEWERVTAPASATFWAIAIPASIAVSSIYTVAAHGIGSSRDLFERFNLTDVLVVWLLSVAIGGLVGGGLRAHAAYKRRARTIRRQDKPLELLKKLALLGTPWPPQWSTAGTHHGFLVEPGGTEPSWLIPQSKAKSKPAGMTASEWDKLGVAFDARIGDQSSLAQLIAALEDPKFEALLPLAWRNAGEPYPLDAEADATASGGMRFILRD